MRPGKNILESQQIFLNLMIQINTEPGIIADFDFLAFFFFLFLISIFAHHCS